MLINILGGDGGGKSTQIGHLLRWLADKGVAARTMAKRDIFDLERFPECDYFGVPYEHVAHQCLPRMRAEGRALFLYYMNAQLIRGLPPRDDEVVILDGYWHKHYATEAALGIDADWLLGMGKVFPEPDLSILLDIDPREIVRRGHRHRPYESGCDPACSDASFIAHQDKVRGYLQELARARAYRIVDAARSEGEVLASLQALVTPALERVRSGEVAGSALKLVV
ncbi:MAG: dTMP kinase [Gammaproteobacteria bacterium]